MPQYSYNFTRQGRPIIPYPQDIVALQELVWTVKPSLIMQTGIAHGGSPILNVSLLVLLDLCESSRRSTPSGGGVDIEIRAHNRRYRATSIARASLCAQWALIDGALLEHVRRVAAKVLRVMVIPEFNHTHAQVLRELELYGQLVCPGGYCVVFDTVVEHMSPSYFWAAIGGEEKSEDSVHAFLQSPAG